MFSSQKGKFEESYMPSSLLSVRVYNLVLGLCILYGLLVNTYMVANFSEFFNHLFFSIHPIFFVIVSIAIGYLGIYINRSSSTPIISFIGYSIIVFVFGADLSLILPEYAGEDIKLAMSLTCVITFLMIILATLFPIFFSRLGGVLLLSLTSCLATEIFHIIIRGRISPLLNWCYVIIFTLYIGYQWYVAQAQPKTVDNAIDAALGLYIKIINLFVRILRIIGKTKRRK
jgi:FtsH-binding integral membrane protein